MKSNQMKDSIELNLKKNKKKEIKFEEKKNKLTESQFNSLFSKLKQQKNKIQNLTNNILESINWYMFHSLCFLL